MMLNVLVAADSAAGETGWFLTTWLDGSIHAFCQQFPAGSFWSSPSCVCGIVVIVLVGLVCGSVGALVVGNRMAFFADALAHCAFAGVALAFLALLAAGLRGEHYRGLIILIMVAFGVVVGLLIAFVREKTGLASDTVIGVFFAGAMGLGGMFTRFGGGFGIQLESFMFGDPLSTTASDILMMFLLLILTLAFLAFFYNALVLTSFNTSLARSRRVPIRLCQYLFIALLGVIINLCLNIVGAMLINALLLLPAAAAANVSRNMRQLFWMSIALCIGIGLFGAGASWEISVRLRQRDPHSPGVGAGGTIIVFGVLVFVFTMFLRSVQAWLQKRTLARPIAPLPSRN